MNIKSIMKFTLSIFSGHKRLITKISGVLLLIASYVIFFPAPQNVRLVNMGSRSAGVTWVSSNRSKGCVVAISRQNIFSSKFTCDSGGENLHLVSIENLLPDSQYQLAYIHGIRIKNLKNIRFYTKSELEDMPPFPNPAYGSVIDQDGEPVEGALVVITPHVNESIYPVAAKTNSDGNFAVDYEEITRASSKVTIEAIGSTLSWSEKSITSKIHTPIPYIRVGSKK